MKLEENDLLRDKDENGRTPLLQRVERHGEQTPKRTQKKQLSDYVITEFKPEMVVFGHACF